MKMKYTLQNVKDSMPEGKAKRDSVWVKLWVRRAANLLAVIALNLGIKPNAVSVVAIVDTILACLFISINNDVLVIIGMVLLNLFIVFDCIDGAMARTLKRNSYMGEFYDALGGYTICAFSLLAAGICAFHSGSTVINYTNPEILIIIGALGSICDILSRLTYQKYTGNTMIANAQMGNEVVRENDIFYEVKPNFSLTYIRLEIDRQLSGGGVFAPIIFLAYIFNCLDIVVILYSIYHILAYFAVSVLFCYKASKFDMDNRK